VPLEYFTHLYPSYKHEKIARTMSQILTSDIKAKSAIDIIINEQLKWVKNW
jgi:hypothetical protein